MKVVYRTHLDITRTIFMRGESQAEFLSRAPARKDNFMILGGGFNTWNPLSIASLDKQYNLWRQP
jgi:hypothetical protein